LGGSKKLKIKRGKQIAAPGCSERQTKMEPYRLISACSSICPSSGWDAFVTLYSPVLKWFWGLIIATLPLILAAWLAAWFGFRKYLKQRQYELIERQHELILKRYLEDGFDRISLCFDHIMGVYYDNYRAAIAVVHVIKNSDDVPREEDYTISIRKYDMQYFATTPFYKIKFLLEDTVFWDTMQFMIAFVDRKTISFKDFNLSIRDVMSGKSGSRKDALLTGISKELQKYTTESFKYAVILEELQIIAGLLEKETGKGWKELEHFKNNPDVMASVQRLKDKFENEFAAFRNHDEPTVSN
jgi:hypothetical protein